MEQHHSLEGLQMVDRIGGLIVALELGEFEVRRNRLLLDFLGERRVSADVVMVGGGSMAEFFNLSINFLKFPIEGFVSIVNLGRFPAVDGEGFLRRKIMIRVGVFCLSFSFSRSIGPTNPSMLPWDRFLTSRRRVFRSDCHRRLLHGLHHFSEASDLLHQQVELLWIYHCCR